MACPRVVHQIWFQGAAAMPPLYRAYARLLRATNPGWDYVLWDDASLRAQCAALGARYAARYDSYAFMHQKIDFGRYVALYRNGGISIDCDMVALRPLDDLPAFSDPAAAGRLALSAASMHSLRRHNLMRWAAGYEQLTAIPAMNVNNAVVMCQEGCAALLALIDAVAALESDDASPFVAIQQTTGPLAITRILEETPGVAAGVLVMDHAFFEPCYGGDPGCAPLERTVVFHQHAGSWLGEGFTDTMRLGQVLRTNTLAQVLVLASSLVLVLCVVAAIGWRACVTSRRGRAP